ncbi:MAG: hypothetical protein JO241_00840 [Candidatus Eremiobacteraeota bacterium]|nr:hypothetical protein [Candidatus Eremiobacteraeota bacterium]
MMLTKYLSKLLGLSIVLIAAGMLANKPAALEEMNALFADPGLMFVTGVFTMIGGLAVVLAHNRWSGSPPAVLVTFYGWVALIKGALFIWLPPPLQADFYRAMHFDHLFYAYLGFALVLAGYLTYEGFTAVET